MLAPHATDAGNYAGSSGGAAHFATGLTTASLTDAHLVYNSAAVSGGAVYGGTTTMSVLLIVNSTVAKNTAVGLSGGAFFGPVRRLEVRQGSDVVGNTASGAGCEA